MCDLVGQGDPGDASIEHDGSSVGDTEHQPRELLDHQHRDAFIGDLSDEAFNALMYERKRMIPKWIKAVMKTKP